MVADLLSWLHDVTLFVLVELFKISFPVIFRIRT
jgi:hypothetical protein